MSARLTLVAALLAALAWLPVPARAGGGAVPLPEDACTAEGDSAPAIEELLRETPNGVSVLFPRGARCRVDRTLDLSVPPAGADTREDTAFDLNGATIFRDEEPACEKIRLCNRPIVALVGVGHVVLRDGNIEGGARVDGLPSFDATREHDHGVAVHGVTGVVLDRLVVRDIGGDCVDVDKHHKDVSSRVLISHLTCTGAGRQGVSANAVRGLTVGRSTFDRIASTAVDLEPRRSGFILDVLVEDNRFGWVGHYAIAGIGSSETWEDVRVEGNEQTDAEHHALAFLRAGNSFQRGPLTVTGNRVRDPIQVNHTSGSASGNTVLGRPECFVQVFNDAPFDVHDNHVPPGVRERCDFTGKIEAQTPNRRLLHTAKTALVWIAVAALAFAALAGVLLLRRRLRTR